MYMSYTELYPEVSICQLQTSFEPPSCLALFLYLLACDSCSQRHYTYCMSLINSKTLNVIFMFSLCLCSVRAASVSESVQRQSPLRTNSEDHGPFKTKDQSPNADKDKAMRKKSTDSVEEADKDFILI